MPTEELPGQAVIGADGAMAVRRDFTQRPSRNNEPTVLMVDGALTVNAQQTAGADYATVNDAGNGNIQDVFLRQGAGNDVTTIIVPGSESTGIVRDVTLNGGSGFNEAVLVMGGLAGRISLSEDGRAIIYSDPHNHVERLNLGDYFMLTVAPRTNGENPDGRFETMHFSTAALVDALRTAPNQSLRLRDLVGRSQLDARSYD